MTQIFPKRCRSAPQDSLLSMICNAWNRQLDVGAAHLNDRPKTELGTQSKNPCFPAQEREKPCLGGDKKSGITPAGTTLIVNAGRGQHFFHIPATEVSTY